jgi:hypothetical protein
MAVVPVAVKGLPPQADADKIRRETPEEALARIVKESQ